MGPAFARTNPSARNESSSSIDRASPSESAVSPGVATTARSQLSSGRDDDVAIGLVPLARRLDPAVLLQPLVDEPAVARAHRLERDGLAGAKRFLRGLHGERLDGTAPAVAIARSVDDDLLAVVFVPAQDRVRERLHRVDRLTVTTDQQTEVARRANRGDRGV